MPPANSTRYPGMFGHTLKGPYSLGFFAAMTIECDDVIIDLNGHTIKQSVAHNIHQRFYANIELANSPFIDMTGPADFIADVNGKDVPFRGAKRCLIHNGTLGLSAHHGIHGNGTENIIINNLKIEKFEVAGIALNGTINSIINEVNIDTIHVPKVISTFSQARFIRDFLLFIAYNPGMQNYTFNSQNAAAILAALDDDIKTTIQEVNDGSVISNEYFKNNTNGYDGNVYGMVFNVNGPVVGSLLSEKTTSHTGCIDIHVNRITIDGIKSFPKEIIGVSTTSNPTTLKVQTGPIGGVLKLEEIIDMSGKYIGNPLSNAQMLIAKVGHATNHAIGTSSITPEVVSWAEADANFFDTLIDDGVNDLFLIGGIDSMAHHMKGNVGILLSGGERISGTDISITDVHSEGTLVGENLDGNIPTPTNTDNILEGSKATGILLTACDGVYLKNTENTVETPILDNNGIVHKIEIRSNNKNLKIQ